MLVGNHHFDCPVFLAPMSGTTDGAFRRHASRLGADVVVTEMVASGELATGNLASQRRLYRFVDEAGPFIVQLAGREAHWMKLAAQQCKAAGAEVIDINMGCPARKVTGGRSGAALMRDLDIARSLIAATMEGADGAVTLKMRLGWDVDSINSPELASIAQAEGVSMITVHGRTRNQFYEGHADWSMVRDVVDAVSIPVIVNGDISNAANARRAMEMSGADGVMVGRAAVGRPWLPGQVSAALNGREIRIFSLEAQLNILVELVDDACTLYGRSLGVRVVRKHISEYLETCDHIKDDVTRKSLKRHYCRIPCPDTLIEELNNFPERCDGSRTLEVAC